MFTAEHIPRQKTIMLGIETRRYMMTSDIYWLQDKTKWPGLKSIGMVESTREIKRKSSHEKRYYISSLECNAEKFGGAVRSHWVLRIQPIGF